MKYYNKVTNHHTTTIKTVIFDGGGKFNSKEFLLFLRNKGINVQVTAPYTPQQNSAKLPSNYWAEAVTTAVFLENVTPLRKLKWKTPYQLWYGRQFDNDWLKPFGCLAFANIPKKLRDGKFGDTSKKGLLVGYQHGAHNWRALLPGGKVKRCHDVTFHASDFPGVSIFAPSDQVFSASSSSKTSSSSSPSSKPNSPSSEPSSKTQLLQLQTQLTQLQTQLTQLLIPKTGRKGGYVGNPTLDPLRRP
ncbi:hypothetical protein PCANC_10601 [Puccinia coronata f. sp. avenae]|uniref:Retroviral polymerase SH3-like domain-containing protein n=1 Tax=Puccinia coronata f. sp. avenae TaxID=200324 RepID=A0A2N5VR71_9BASI|nr:hypothetical protein PCANC_10601 [Puccinia coronata f. sp. avenae]